MKNKKIQTMLIIIGALVLLTGGLIWYYLSSTIYRGMVPTVEGSHSLNSFILPDIQTISEDEYRQGADVEIDALHGSPEPIYKAVPISDKVYNVLVIGDDARRGDPRGRADTQILCSFNRETKEIKMASFMRDVLIPISEDKWNRINTPYMTGGPGKAINTINKIFSLDLNRYVIVRFDSVFALVDRIGGIDVQITDAEAKYVNRIFPEYDQLSEGLAHMNGKQALAFARARKISGSGDFERTRRQRDVIKAALDKTRQVKDPAQLLSLINFAAENVETNIPLDEIITMGMEIINSGSSNLLEFRIPVDNSYRFATYQNASILTINFKKNIQTLHEFLYGTSQGVKIPTFGEPIFDGDLIEETPLPEQFDIPSPTPSLAPSAPAVSPGMPIAQPSPEPPVEPSPAEQLP